MSGTVIAEERKTPEGTSQRYYYGGPERVSAVADPVVKYLTDDQKRDLIQQMQGEMKEAAENLEYERAAELRDAIAQIEEQLG